MVLCGKGIKKLTKESAKDLVTAITFVLIIIKRFMFVPGYIEKYHFINDFAYSTLKPQADLIKGIVGLFRDNFNGFAGNALLYKPSKLFKFIWKVIVPVIPKKTLERIRFVDEGKERENIDFMDLDD